jgi:glycine/D-amino acid oxidase-like deaminating enzyme
MKEQCLWHLSSPEPLPVLEPLTGDRNADVVVVGGGITGLSTALHLAEAGTQVVLIEAADIPSGGSGLNVGLVNAGMWTAPDSVCKALGNSLGERANSILGAAPERVFELIARHGIDCQPTRTGTLHLAHNAAGERELIRREEQFRRRGAPVELIGEAECQQKIGTSKIRRALQDHRAGTIHPVAYTRGLARAATKAGATLYCQTPAMGIKRAGDLWRVSTPNGAVTAARVVLATNAYTQDDWNDVKKHFFLSHYFQVSSPPLSAPQAEEILPERQGCWDTRLVLSSIRRDAQGRLILGSLGRGDHRPVAYVRGWANRVQQHYFPQLGKIDWEYSWSGRMAFTPDTLMRLFEPAPGILAATAYNGRGNTTGTIVGRGFAPYILNGDDSELPLPIQPFKPVRGKALWSAAYESGFTLYHAGQCLRILI